MTTTKQSTPAEVGIGDIAPDFTLPDQHGNPVTLSQFRGKKNVVLFFYPAAFSAGCTAEACAFRDSHEVFKEAGAEVIGISMDNVEKQSSFAKRFNLTYTLLADDGSVWKSFGVPNRFGLIRGRVTYVIDKQGVVQHVFNSQVMVLKHVNQAIETLKKLG
jgi:peroxiredoxin Q/BCP